MCAELEALESQLAVVEEEAAQYKKAARLWKARYKQERTARYEQLLVCVEVFGAMCRLAAEERINGLQQIVDETFQQFALEDSEDDSTGEPSDADTSSPS